MVCAVGMGWVDKMILGGVKGFVKIFSSRCFPMKGPCFPMLLVWSWGLTDRRKTCGSVAACRRTLHTPITMRRSLSGPGDMICWLVKMP